MSSTKFKVDLFPVREKHYIPAVARTIHKSFSSDPLIRWLRPNAVPWAHQNTSTWNWQYRRIQHIMSKGEVFRSMGVEQMAVPYPQKGLSQEPAIATSDRVNLSDQKLPASLCGEDNSNFDDDAGAVVFLFPPPGRITWSIPRICLACKLWLLDWLKPAHDSGAREKTRYPSDNLWYLEVVTVHPSLQSRGLGGGVMRWILDHVNGEPIYLECTRKENVGFYESFGFEVAEEVEMAEEGQEDLFKHWVMVHPGKS
ncbi:hypothetical protein N7452_004959 [Penicillium brevicompactum]|uniref:N-acetyltransferase domain-containing protein n=1 Tax=Penicillium brevicompactum TaxID=5074 RepID=A0A9W9QHY9_PENBR|nr:hypothetical protein N7452_004959 [Penicillium brevicompactum]